MNKRLKMALRIVPVFLLSGVLLVAATRPAVATVPGNNSLISVNNSGNGQGGNATSSYPSISRNGRHIAFESQASNLVGGDTNSKVDIFVRDLISGLTERVSVSTNGTQANNSSGRPNISASGRYVVFSSTARNLIDGITLPSGGPGHVYLHDIQTDATEIIDISSSGAISNGLSDSAIVSEDGRFVAFTSYSTNLVSATNDSSTRMKIFVKDRVLNTTTLLSRTIAGAVPNGHSFSPSMSCDGAFVTFTSLASDLTAGDANGSRDVFLVQRVGGDYLTNLTQAGTADSEHAHISCNGNFVTVNSYSQLDGNDTDSQYDNYVFDRLGSSFERVNVASDETPANAQASDTTTVSDDGRFVVFGSNATNLDPLATTSIWQIYMRDRESGTTEIVTKNATPVAGNAFNALPVINPLGTKVTYTSNASNLVASDTNNQADIFIALTGN
jgi:hypothetical protein